MSQKLQFAIMPTGSALHTYRVPDLYLYWIDTHISCTRFIFILDKCVLCTHIVYQIYIYIGLIYIYIHNVCVCACVCVYVRVCVRVCVDT